MKRFLLPAFLVFVLLAVAATLRPHRATGSFDLDGFASLPALANGRLKPLDTTARVTLLTLQGRQHVTDSQAKTIPPAAWLLDVLFRPAQADALQVFEINHPQVLAALSLDSTSGAGGKRFSLEQLRPGLRELDRLARSADDLGADARSDVQRDLIRLRNNVALYQRLQSTFIPPGSDDFLLQLIAREHPPSAATVTPASPSADELRRLCDAIDGWSLLQPVPPETEANHLEAWRTFGAAVRSGIGARNLDGASLTYARLGLAWQRQDPDGFNRLVAEQRVRFRHLLPRDAWRAGIETRFNAAQPFQTALALYVVAFLAAACSWLRWPDVLRRVGFHLVGVGFVLSTVGIAVRMWLEGRPPVTNLYSSALFVGWAAVGLCLVLERLHRNSLGTCAAGLIGFATLLIAHHLSLGGDTLEMMRAVLDSNFWLATHVVTITVGYSATFLAGALAMIALLRGIFTPSLDRATAASVQRMVYGIVCFATLFSFVGTVLGGIWADQSWGRFWGWDPKENGALILVLWNALILHARWGGLVQLRGLLALAVAGNVVTAWSWFGVNMLGVGLHSYGFMDAAFWWLVVFVASQLAVIALALLPSQRWRSAAGLGFAQS